MVMMMMMMMVMMMMMMLTRPAASSFSMPSPYGYLCQDNSRCVKEVNTGVKPLLTLNECKLTCGTAGSLWPLPQSASLGNSTVQFLPGGLSLEPSVATAVLPLLQEAYNLFLDTLHRYHPYYQDGKAAWLQPWDPAVSSHQVRVKVTVRTVDTWLTLSTDESYELVVNTSGDTTTATITAATFFGARHALETLAQLVAYHETRCALMLVTKALVKDAPAFPYRGLLLDTSRNFYSVAAIQRTLDAMAANKLNTFHWHITDSQSFPLYLESLPNMAYYGAYSSDAIYHPHDIKHIMHYAKVRGIRVLPELDVPGHVGNGWQWGQQQGLGKLAVCVNREPWQEFCSEPPCGQLNLANPNIYIILGRIYQEITQLFAPLDLFHYGGDVVNLNCWNTSEEITSWMLENNMGLEAEDYYTQWGAFQDKARTLFTEANGGEEVPGILWTSELTKKERIESHLNNSQYIIQIWTSGEDSLIADLLTKRYKVIFSNWDAWYLDCGAGAWLGEGGNWCSPYKEWQTVYDNSPEELVRGFNLSIPADLILGGEAALWSEQTDGATLDAKLWPRGAALGERLWSNPAGGWQAAESRFIHHRQRLVQRGIQADRIQPQWCHHNHGLCYK